MSTPYAGNPASFPANYLIPDDGDPRNASSVDIAFEALGDRTAFLKSLLVTFACAPVVQEFLASGPITPPANALPWAFYDGYGGGGSGGVGGNSQVPSKMNSGGGGGGGAVRNSGMFPIVPGEQYDVSIGAGGSGTVFGIGNPGGDTTITRHSTGTKVVTCRGAGGGHPGIRASDFGCYGPTPVSGQQVNEFAIARGGSPTRPKTGDVEPGAEPTCYASLHYDRTPQAGGMGVAGIWNTSDYGGQTVANVGSAAVNSAAGRPGNPSPEGYEGGRGGIPGAILNTNITYAGGGAGGGGGAGPGGNGGDGGNGSDSTTTTSASLAPGAGTSAAANTGAGGGGGGGAGSGVPNTTVGALPGDGGSGRMRITYLVPMTS